MPPNGDFTIVADKNDQGRRLDVVIAAHLCDCSRSYAAHLIADEKVRVDGQSKKPGYRVRIGEEIRGHLPAPQALDFKPEPIDLDILFEDKYLIVINKQAGLVVHPAPGHHSGTLVNALLFHCPDLSGIGGELRPGIVHRLDKDTSGVLVVAKTAAAHEDLCRQFRTRKIQKQYLALVYGEMGKEDGTVCLPIGRHPVDRKRMSVASRKSREAETGWRVQERFGGITLLELDLKTGRTHQIRVHCAAINHPIVGDPVYRPRSIMKNVSKLPQPIPDSAMAAVKSAKRQMLHAWRLKFTHPQSREPLLMTAPIAEDLQQLIEVLRTAQKNLLIAK
jgi:23S rRNA pseudouridine1911/1915/1917 synthase